MRTIIAGCRDIECYATVAAAVKESGFEITTVVSGGARGVDRLGERWAREHGVALDVRRADWTRHGKAAGVIRNTEMARCADALVAVWDSRSPGTRHMIEAARKHGLKVYVKCVSRPRK